MNNTLPANSEDDNSLWKSDVVLLWKLHSVSLFQSRIELIGFYQCLTLLFTKLFQIITLSAIISIWCLASRNKITSLNHFDTLITL